MYLLDTYEARPDYKDLEILLRFLSTNLGMSM